MTAAGQDWVGGCERKSGGGQGHERVPHGAEGSPRPLDQTTHLRQTSHRKVEDPNTSVKSQRWSSNCGEKATRDWPGITPYPRNECEGRDAP